MGRYIIRRLLLLPVILIGVTMMIFAMLSFLKPGERAALYVRELPKNERMMDGIIKRYGLNDPIPVQYWHWMFGRRDTETGQIVGGIMRGEFGYSRTGNQTVADLIKRRFPATIELTLYSILPIIAVRCLAGHSRRRQSQYLDRPTGACVQQSSDTRSRPLFLVCWS